MKIKECLIQVGEEQNQMLRIPLFDVNMRLYVDNAVYNDLVKNALDYMVQTLCTEFSDYPKIKGISGANLGIPFNLVIIRKEGSFIRMINPKYTAATDKVKVVESNCGSINLNKPIKVKRFKEIHVTYIAPNGRNMDTIYSGRLGCTIQHEIDHNKGVLITDKAECK